MKTRHPLLAALALGTITACGGGSESPEGAPSSGTPTRQAASHGSDTPAGAVPDEVVLKLRPGADGLSLLAEHGLVVLGQFGSRPIYRVRGAAGADAESVATRLAADPRIQYAEPNLITEAPEGRRHPIWAIGGDAGTYATQWNGQALRLAEAHTLSAGAGVVVAVLDTGLDHAHPALAGRVVAGFDFVDFDTDPSEAGSAGDAGFGHGTHVASLVVQVAPQARILPIRVLDKTGAGNIWVLAEGLLHAVDPDGTPITDDGAKVINLSLGTTRRSALLADILDAVSCGDDYDDDNDPLDADKVRCAGSSGALVTSAAGNSGDDTLHYPAAERHEGALAVAASTQAGALATFSTRGDWVQVAAPGALIYGAIPGGRWAVWSGTSMAAPMVAGAAALVRSRFPEWKPSDVAAKLTSDGLQLCGSALKRIDPVKVLGGASAAANTCP